MGYFMTEKELQERESVQLEIQARRVVLNKVENAFKRLKIQAEANYEKRKEKVLAARSYRSIDEAHDAWGYDLITDKEFEEIKKIFESGDEYIKHKLSPQEISVKILGHFMGRLEAEIRNFEFQLLSTDKQEHLKKPK